MALRQHGQVSPARRGPRAGFVAAAALAAAAVWPVFGGGVSSVAAQEQTTWSGVYTSAQASRGADIYNSSCAACHGDDLGGGEMGPGLAGSSFTSFWNDLSLGDLYGVMSVSMPQDNPGSMTPDQYVDVIAYMLEASEFPAGDGELSEAALGDIMILAAAP